MPDDILTIDDVAALWKTTRQAIYSCTRSRRAAKGLPVLPALRIGKELRFLRSDVDKFIAALRR